MRLIECDGKKAYIRERQYKATLERFKMRPQPVEMSAGNLYQIPGSCIFCDEEKAGHEICNGCRLNVWGKGRVAGCYDLVACALGITESEADALICDFPVDDLHHIDALREQLVKLLEALPKVTRKGGKPC